MNIWTLPRETVIGGEVWHHATDYRDILRIVKILSHADDSVFPWLRAMSAFYREPLTLSDPDTMDEQMKYLADFISCGREEVPCLCFGIIDWELDAQEILEGVNAAAGIDIREKEELHWWTFVSLFHCIRKGRLADLVAIRWKLQTGKPLTDGEKAYVRSFPDKFRPKESEADKQHRQKLEEMLA